MMQGLEDKVLMDILARAVGPARAPVAFDAFHAPSSVSIRFNPFKVGPSLAGCSRQEAQAGRNDAALGMPKGWDSHPVPWSPYGRMLNERPNFTLDPLFHAGCYYVQDSSAMAVGHIFREQLGRFEGLGRPVRALDLCAAPGGKATDMAVSLRERFGDSFILVANEVVRGRASVLCDNIAVWGDPDAIVTSVDPKAIGRLEGFFDIVVADVPCSGEGMFRKDRKAVEEWSPETVALCAARQKRILADAWPAIRQGGVLVYSTCTFEEAENDSNVEWAASELGGEIVAHEYASMPGVVPTRTGGLFVPGHVQGEGQFVAAVEKSAASGGTRLGPEALHPLRSGLVKGVRKGDGFIPSADWALSIDPPVDEYPAVDLDSRNALKYLHCDNVFIDGFPLGYLMVRFEGHPLGFVKNIGKRWNNLHPRNRRIRMDI